METYRTSARDTSVARLRYRAGASLGELAVATVCLGGALLLGHAGLGAATTSTLACEHDASGSVDCIVTEARPLLPSTSRRIPREPIRSTTMEHKSLKGGAQSCRIVLELQGDIETPLTRDYGDCLERTVEEARLDAFLQNDGAPPLAMVCQEPWWFGVIAGAAAAAVALLISMFVATRALAPVTIEIDRAERVIRVKARLFGTRRRRGTARTFPLEGALRAEFDEINVGQTRWWEVTLHREDGARATLLSGVTTALRARTTAQWLTEAIQQSHRG